jgi:hypothetical protein
MADDRAQGFHFRPAHHADFESRWVLDNLATQLIEMGQHFNDAKKSLISQVQRGQP